MSDPLDVTNLEKDGRLMAIRKLRGRLYRMELVVTFVFSLLLIFTSGGFQLTPLYVPLESFIYFILVMGLIVTVEVFVFRYLEITLSRSRNGRFFMVRKAQRRGVVYALLSLGLLLVLVTPTVLSTGEEFMSTGAEDVNVLGFYNDGVLGVTRVESVTVTGQEDVQVYVVTEDAYMESDLDRTQLQNAKLNTKYQVPGGVETEINLPSHHRSQLYVVVMSDDSLASADVALQTHFAPYITDIMPIFALVYAAAYTGYVVWLTPKRYRMRTEAIYG